MFIRIFENSNPCFIFSSIIILGFFCVGRLICRLLLAYLHCILQELKPFWKKL